MSNSGGYLGNPMLKGSSVPIEWTEELIEEYMKCAKDPIHFAEKYIKIVHVDLGFIPIELYDYQKEIIQSVSDNRFTVVNASRQAGKCLDQETIIRLRNKKTGEIKEMPIGTFYESNKR